MATFESVASTVISSSTSIVTFSNINSSNLYDHFLLTFYYQASGSGGSNVNIRLNEDSSSNYNYLRTMVASDATTVSATSNETIIDIADVGGSNYNSASVWIIGAQTNRRKNVYSQGATDGNQRVKFNFGQYMSSSSISSVSVFMGDSKNILNATVALYGIRGS